MKSKKRVAAFSALAVACAPVVASATVLFEDNFNAGTSATRYDAFIYDRANGNDGAADFNFNYGNFTYFFQSPDESQLNLSAQIPLAPRSAVGSPAIGLRLDVNNDGSAPSPNTATINLYPKLTEYLNDTLPSGDHKITVDVWMNYNGRELGGGGSTEHMNIGINHEGGGVGGSVSTDAQGVPFQMPAGGPFDGLSWSVNGERGNNFDYRFWRNNIRVGGPDGLNPETGYVAVDGGPGQPGPGDGRNTYYQAAFPKTNPSDANDIWYETAGAIGKHWTTAEMKYEDGIVYFYLLPEGSTAPPVLIGARTEDSVVSGHVMLGYSDLNNGTAALENGGGSVTAHDANFVVFDNVVVETISQTRQKWNFNGGGNWSEAAKWDNGEPNAVTHVADFTTALTSPAAVNVDAARTVRSIVFDSAQSYTVSGANTITIDSITDGVLGTIKGRSGSHTISAPVTLNRPLIFDVSPGSQVALTNLNANGFRLVKNGGGTATVNHLRAPSLTVNAGTMQVAPNAGPAGASVVPVITLGTGAKLDITDNKLITSNPLGSESGGIYSGVQGWVQSASNGGAWDGPGLTTSMPDAAGGLTSIGVATGEQVRGLGPTDTDVFAGQTITGASTIAMYTYAGDANLDGQITGDDYSSIDFNIAVPGADGWYNGDFNYDGIISGDDYSVIDFNIVAQGAPFSTAGSAELSGVTPVPEPAAACGLALLATGLLARRRRRHFDIAG